MQGYILNTLLLFILFNVTLKAQEERPNILLIIADDMGIDVTNGYQSNAQMPVTPNLDQLMANGLRMTNAWSAPQCTPTRASIMSGKYGIKTGVMRPPGNLDLVHQSLFDKIDEETNGAYAGAVIGKWHISAPVNLDHPTQHGVGHYEGFLTSTLEDYYAWTKTEDGMQFIVNEYATSHLTNAAISWVSQQTDPWFLWLAHGAPHSPFHVPPAGTFSQIDTTDDLGKYLASIESMDYEIGRLLASMDAATLENTVIIFVGDNGTPAPVIQNFPSNHAKSTLYEGGVRIPMIISGKGVSRINESDDNLTHVADLYSTIIELAGIQLNGGTHNSMSLKPLLSCDDDLNRSYIYTDYEDGNIEGWAIRNQEYKLIEDEIGRLEFYKISEDILETNDLVGNLTSAEATLLAEMQAEANIIRTDWSCTDGIQNGTENTIDDCNNTCPDDDSLSTGNIGCCDTPTDPSVYYEYISGSTRNIYTNNFPNHNYCYNSVNQMPSQVYHDFGIDLSPTITGEITSVLRANGRPARYFGVAKNGVIFAPAPAAPFIFEDASTGEYNWDWVFEPTNNQGQGADVVGLDCASAHTGPQGYHYHGNMFAYAENEVSGISTTTSAPASPLHIGWAADGFPIVYRFGPDEDGNIKELAPSYQLKAGLRPGDGISAPCGAYNGKYTNDYEYICGKGELDECNGIQSMITVETVQGMQTFGYFYVITASFPQIPRCLVGNVSEDFDNGNAPLMGNDQDNDGFIESYDCDDADVSINPLAAEIAGNAVDENCDGVAEQILPVEFISFIAVLETEGVNLVWEVGEEVNVSRYVVQHSTDSINFNAIGEVEADDSEEYDFLHIDPSIDINFYRIAVEDFDVNISYSDIVSVNLTTEISELSKNHVYIYPNPSSGIVRISLANQEIGDLRILGMDGTVISTYDETSEFDIQHFNAGIYIVQITNLQGKSFVQKLIVY